MKRKTVKRKHVKKGQKRRKKRKWLMTQIEIRIMTQRTIRKSEFVVEDQEIEDDDRFKVEKHVHTVNFDEAGDYLVAINRYMEAFAKIVRWGKDDVAQVI